MDEYNKLRRMMGFPIEYELGLTLAEYQEKRSKQLADLNRSLLVHVTCVGEDGNAVGNMNGLFYLGGGQESFVLTTAHVLGWGGATNYHAYFCDEAGTPYSDVPLQLVKAGAVIPDKQPAAPQAHEYLPDLAVFKVILPDGAAMPMVAPPMPPAQPFLGDKTYILAYVHENHNYSFTDGTVSSGNVHVYHTTAYADNGHSGAPVMSTRGHLLGLVVHGVGVSIKQVAFIPVNVIDAFLTMGEPRLPHLPGV